MKKILVNQFWDQDKIKEYLDRAYVYTEDGKYSTSKVKAQNFSNLLWIDNFLHKELETDVFFFLYESHKIKCIVILEQMVDGKKVVFLEGYSTAHLAFKKYGTSFLKKSGYKNLKTFLSLLNPLLMESHLLAVTNNSYEAAKNEREAVGDFSDTDVNYEDDSFKL